VSNAGIMSCSPISPAAFAVNAGVVTLRSADTSTKRTSGLNAWTAATRSKEAAYADTSSVSLPSLPILWRPNATLSRFPKTYLWRSSRRSVAAYRQERVPAAVMAARIVGADPIIGVDINPMRLELALDLGATHTIDNRHDDVASHIASITGRGVDYVLEITGEPEMLQLAVNVLNPQGTVALFTGESGPDSLPEERKAISIIEGDAVPQRFIPKLISLHRAGRFPFDRLIKLYGFNEINKAIADAKHGHTIKPVLRVSEQ
jgi:hypothetical protein